MSRERRPSGKGGAKRGTRAAPQKGFKLKANERYNRHDAYFRKAKRDGYLARSVYKLEEIDKQFSLFRSSDAVLDLGCAPGSWMQYVHRRLDAKRGGCAVGIDLLPTKITFGGNIRVILGDIYEATDEMLAPEPGRRFNVVLSDMAPNTTGIRSVDQDRSLALCERTLDIALRMLEPGGHMCVKILEGGGLKGYTDACRKAFASVKIRRPKGTRAGSTETYVVALDRKANTEGVPESSGEDS